MIKQENIQSIAATPAMRYYYDELGYNERLVLNRLWTITDPEFDGGRLRAAAEKIATVAPDTTLRARLEGGALETLFLSEGPAVSFLEVDLSHVADPNSAIEELCLQNQKCMDLDGASPLYRLTVFKTGKNTVVHLCLKHIATDDRGLSLFIKRLEECYHDPDSAMDGPKARLQDWSDKINALAARSPHLPPQAIEPFPSFNPSRQDFHEQATAEALFGGFHTDEAVRRYYTEWSIERGAPKGPARSMRSLMMAMPDDACRALQFIRAKAGLDFDVVTQGIARAARQCFSMDRISVDIDRSLRTSPLGDMSDGIFMVNELIPQGVSAIEKPGISDYRRQKEERRAGTMDWLAWKAKRSQLIEAGFAASYLQAPGMVVNYRVESDRATRNFLNAERSTLFNGENHNAGRTNIPLGFWLQINLLGSKMILILEWQMHVANHWTAKSFLEAIVRETTAIARSAAASLEDDDSVAQSGS